MLYMFRTILVHHQEQLYKLYIAFGICRYHTSGCCVAIAMCIGTVHTTSKRQEKYVWGIHVTRSPNVYTTSAILTADNISLKRGAIMAVQCRWQQYNALGSWLKVLDTLPKFGFPRQIFMKVLNVRFHGNPSSGDRGIASLWAGRSGVLNAVGVRLSVATQIGPKARQSSSKMVTGSPLQG